jgi:hypothetical protein
MQYKSSAQNAGQREEGHIDADELGEIPAHGVDQQAIAREHDATTENPTQTPAAQTPSHGGITGHFQTSGHQKNKPRQYIHYVSNLESRRRNDQPFLGARCLGLMMRAWAWRGTLKREAKPLKVHQARFERAPGRPHQAKICSDYDKIRLLLESGRGIVSPI